MGATGPFFRFFGPDGFFIVGILSRSTAVPRMSCGAKLLISRLQPVGYGHPDFMDPTKRAIRVHNFISHISFRKNRLMLFAVFLRYFSEPAAKTL
jgi:hypothetical protein